MRNVASVATFFGCNQLQVAATFLKTWQLCTLCKYICHKRTRFFPFYYEHVFPTLIHDQISNQTSHFAVSMPNFMLTSDILTNKCVMRSNKRTLLHMMDIQIQLIFQAEIQQATGEQTATRPTSTTSTCCSSRDTPSPSATACGATSSGTPPSSSGRAR